MSSKFRSRNVSALSLFISAALGTAAGGGCTAPLIIPYADAGAGGSNAAGGESGTGGATGTGGTTTVGTGGNGIGGTGGRGTGGTAGGPGAGGTAGTGTGGSGSGGMGVAGAGAGGASAGGTAGATDGGFDVPTGQQPTTEGDLVITEIMADSNIAADDVGEWFELYNPSATVTFDLMGCNLFDMSTTNRDEITAHLLVAPHSYVTLARFGTSAGGFVPNYNYHPNIASTTDVKFGNDGDQLILNCSSAVIDLVSFRTWLNTDAGGGMVPKGRSFSLDPSHYNAADNDLPSSWCTGTTPFAASDFGTPGRANPTCTCSIAAGGCAF